jgi:leader peptidase (prepilin peptidase)/N-methyltransferase
MELILVVLLGLIFGSFSNVLILRIPEAKSIVFPPSTCPKCNTKLKPWHNIPLLSYIFLKGKCAYCKEKISIQYPLVEFLNGVIFLSIYLKFGDFVTSLPLSVVFSLLLSLSLIDIKYKAVPDSLNILALSLAVVFAPLILDSFTNALLFAGGFSLLRFYVSYIIKKEAMGEADIIIASTIGAILGVKLGVFAIFLSAFIALPILLVLNQKNYELPYVPFLALALYLVYIFDAYALNFIQWLYGV